MTSDRKHNSEWQIEGGLSQPMEEQSIFLQAIELGENARAEFLLAECHDEQQLARMQQLLALHEQQDLPVDRAALESDFDENAGLPVSGEVIGNYRLRALLGKGGMGAVYMAEQTAPVQRTVALKIIRPGLESEQFITRFRLECQTLAMMEHPNIARVLDVGTDADRPYFAMEFVHGVSITRYCRDTNKNLNQRLSLFADICKAIQHAHLKGVIHRDLKPSNVLVAVHEDDPVVKVIDFGVAKAIAPMFADRTTVTQGPQLIGTPLYMSPEQAEMGGSDVDTRTDVYSLGALLYELLTGVSPFGEELAGATYDEMRRVLRESDPVKPSDRLTRVQGLDSTADEQRKPVPLEFKTAIEGELDWITIRAMEKDPSRRYQSVRELLDDVQRYLTGERVHACPPSRMYALRKFVSKHRWPVTTGIVAATLLLAGTAISAALAIKADNARQAATEATRAAKDEANLANANREFLRDHLLIASLEGGRNNISLSEALDRAARQIEGRYQRQPVVAAEIHVTVGLAYKAMGELAPANHHIALATELLEEERGPNDRKTLRARYHAASLRLVYDRENPEPDSTRANHAAELLELTMAAQRMHLGPEDPDTLVTMGDLAHCYALCERFEEAMNLFNAANSGMARHLDREDTRLRRCLEQTTACLVAQGREDEAQKTTRDHHDSRNLPKVLYGPQVEIMEQLVRSREKALGLYAPRTLDALSHLGNALMQRKSVDDAERVFQRLLTRQKHRWGSEHASVRETQRRLGHLYMQSDRLSKAADYFRLTLAAPKVDPLAQQDARALGEILLLADMPREGAELYGALAAARERTYGLTDDRTVKSFAKQAITYSRMGDVEQAGAIADRLAAATASTNPDVLNIRMWIGASLRNQHRLAEATDVLTGAYASSKATAEPDISLQLRLATELSLTLLVADKPEQAMPLATESHAIAREQLGDRSNQAFNTTIHLATVHTALHQYSEAHELALEAVEIRSNLTEFGSRQTLGNLSRIIGVFTDLRETGFAIDQATLAKILPAAIKAARKKDQPEKAKMWSELLTAVLAKPAAN